MYQDLTEQFSGNTSINDEIHEMLARTAEPSRSRMRRKIRQQGNSLRKTGTEQADADARHIFRELLIGVRLNDSGLQLEYNARIGSQTPDWYDASRKLLLEVFTCERGGKSEPKGRVADRIEKKINVYTGIVRDNDLFFIIAVYADFVTAFDAHDCEHAIKDAELFRRFPILSGVVFFTESNVRWVQRDDGSTGMKQEYDFAYFANPFAGRKIDLSRELSQIY